MLRSSLILLLVLGSWGCASSAPEPAAARVSRFLREHSQTPADVADAMREGRVLPEMSFDQVLAAVGPPESRTHFGTAAGAEIWLYYGARLSPKQPGTHGASLMRMVFVDGRVRSIDPI